MVTGRNIGGYQILEELGRGAMGVVFKARQLSMDRIVAIKFLPKKLAQDERIVARFLREARAAGQLAHPNIVSVHELGLADGLHFIAMEYVDGNSIQKKIKDKGAYTEKDTLDIAGQIAEALKMAHGKGILHRDIKPDNFLIDSAGRVRLADLGLALIQSTQDGGLTQDGTTLGTPHFMAPEQCSGTNVDARSDLYSLGASMFVMATGRTPYEGNTAAAVMVKVLTELPQSVKKIRADLSPGFVALVEKMMHKDPSKRFQDAQSAADAIHQCLNGTYKAAAAPRSAAQGKSSTTKSPASTSKDRDKEKEKEQASSTEKPGTRALKPGESKLMPLLLGGLAAVVFLGLLVFMSRNKQTAPVVNRSTVPAQTATTPTVKNTSSVALIESHAPVIGTKHPDESRVPAETEKDRLLFTFLRKLSTDFETGKIKPNDAYARLSEFRKENFKLLMTADLLRRRVNKLEADIALKLKPVADDWKKLDAKVDADLKDGRIVDALAKLSDFQTENAGTSEAAKAAERVEALCSGVLANADKMADTGRLKEARALLFGVVKLPEKQDAAFKAAIAGYDERIKLLQELTDCYARAVQKALYYDPVPKTRFQFQEAMKYCREASNKARNETSKKDLAELSEVFKIAENVFSSLRSQLATQPVDVPSLGTFKNVKITQWDDRGLTFMPDGFKQLQSFYWDQLSAPEVLFQLVKEMKSKDLDKPLAQWELGALALCLGNQAAAGKWIREAVSKDESPLKPQAAVALKLLKPVDPATVKPDKVEAVANSGTTALEDDASALFKDLQDAKKAANKEKLKAIRVDFDGKFAGTDFVKAHKKEIDDLLGAPAVAVVETPKPVTPDKPKVEALPNDEQEAQNYLKQYGWTEIIGTWTLDKKANAFRVDGVAEVVNPALEGDVSLRFQLLKPDAKVRVLMRVEKTLVADRFLGFGGKTSLGFGADFGWDQAFVYMDYQTKKGASKDPVQYGGALKVDQRPIHAIEVGIHGPKMTVWVDGRESNTTGDARATGDTRVIINGPVLVYIIKVTKSK
ncbi:MAG: serine/threonine-protein kinase [Planctomycetota bacterium]